MAPQPRGPPPVGGRRASPQQHNRNSIEEQMEESSRGQGNRKRNGGIAATTITRNLVIVAPSLNDFQSTNGIVSSRIIGPKGLIPARRVSRMVLAKVSHTSISLVRGLPGQRLQAPHTKPTAAMARGHGSHTIRTPAQVSRKPRLQALPTSIT
jgi:hypothetical protein